MAITPGRINFGKAEVYMGVTPPASTNPPTILTLTAGVPATGTNVGSTISSTIFSHTPKGTEIMVEQNLSPVDYVYTEVHAELDFEFAESNVANYLSALGSLAVQGTSGNTDVVSVGGYVLPTFITVCAVQQRRDNQTKYLFFLLYKTYTAEAFKFDMARGKHSSFKVKFKGIADVSRVAGDQLFQSAPGV